MKPIAICPDAKGNLWRHLHLQNRWSNASSAWMLLFCMVGCANGRIRLCQSYKYLGIWMHQSLGRFRNPSDPSQKKPWDEHVEYTKRKIESRKFLLRKMKCQQGGFSPRMAKNLLQAHACSVATYGAEIWNTAANGSDKIEQVFAQIPESFF